METNSGEVASALRGFPGLFSGSKPTGTLARAVSSGLTADRDQSLAAEKPNLENARKAEEIQAKLFPGGISIVNASFLAASGNTARITKLLDEDPEIATFLKTIPVRGKGTLLDTTQSLDRGRSAAREARGAGGQGSRAARGQGRDERPASALDPDCLPDPLEPGALGPGGRGMILLPSVVCPKLA